MRATVCDRSKIYVQVPVYLWMGVPTYKETCVRCAGDRKFAKATTRLHPIYEIIGINWCTFDEMVYRVTRCYQTRDHCRIFS